MVAALAACGEPGDPRPPGWHVDGGFLRAPDGRAVILRGANLGDQKFAPYLDDKQPADYARLREAWGMNALRFVMTWAAIEPAPGVFDDAYLDRVAERMQWARDAGIHVVLDMHQDIYGEGFGFDGAPRWTCDESRYAAFMPVEPWFLNALDPNVTACVDEFYTRADLREHFVAAWRHVAERLADEPAVIGFDVLNEPNWGTYPVFDFENDRLVPLYVDVVTAVRQAAPSWVVFAEPSASRNAGIATQLVTLPFDDVVYAPHSYDPDAEAGGGFDETHRQKILDTQRELADEARTLGAALWIGEYGGMADAPGIVPYMTAEYDAAGSVAAGSMYWSYDKGDGGYSMLAADGSEKPELIGVLVRPYPELVAGDPIAYAFDAATSTFTFDYTPDAALDAATEIAIPPRLYPTGYTVECGECAVEQGADRAVIVSPGAGKVTIRPR
ncbi:MAG TPA: cellulase family glycosylhydrolase [Kofleriaceae bacterium]|nr:cellulase family glycosylhydrolase [Kofleriaceae bacterium]